MVVTNEKIQQMKDCYQANKEDLKSLKSVIREHGCTDTGISDVGDSFEQGYQNALEFVFGVLNIKLNE